MSCSCRAQKDYYEVGADRAGQPVPPLGRLILPKLFELFMPKFSVPPVSAGLMVKFNAPLCVSTVPVFMKFQKISKSGCVRVAVDLRIIPKLLNVVTVD